MKILNLLKNSVIYIIRIVLLIPLAVLLRYIKSKFDSLIYSIILLTEDAIVFAENTPEHLHNIFLLTEKIIDLLIKIVSFIFKVAAYPVNKILSLIFVILSYIKRKIDSLIYSIILLTEDAIIFAENTPEHLHNIFLLTEKIINLLLKIVSFIFKVVAYPVNKVISLLLAVFRYIKRKTDALIYSIILLTEKAIVVAENTPEYTQNLFVTSSKKIRSLTTVFVLKQKLNLLKFQNDVKLYDLPGKRNLFLARTTIFILRRKRNLITLRDKAKNSALLNKFKQYALLIRLDKPIGILLLLWPTLIALWIAAEGWPDQDVLLVFVAGVFLMRSAGCAINDYADRDIDCQVTRTKDRPLTSGKITAVEALIIFAVLSITAFVLVLTMNSLTIAMSFVGLVLAASYPFMKRHHYLPQIHLGAAFGWAVPMAYAAQANELSTVTWLLFIATVLWATAYDTMYAMVDRDDDLKIGVKSTAILFESADTLIIGIIQALLILCLIMIGQNLELGLFYFSGVLVATGFAIWQQRLIRDREPAQCFKAFLNNNWLGLALFTGVFLEYQIGDITL